MTRRWTEDDLRALQKPLVPTVVTEVRRKYGNHRVEADGYQFDSKKEAARYWTLRLQQKAGAIESLEVHPHYDLFVCGVKIGKYIGDFRYRREGNEVVEDVKGVRTAVYRLKKRLMKAVHQIDVVEV